MSVIQILGVLFLLFAISRVILRWRDRLLPTNQFFLWIFIFSIILTILLIPELSASMAKFFGIGRGADLIMYSSVVFLFYLVFRIYVAIENIDNKLTAIIRQEALKNISEPKK